MDVFSGKLLSTREIFVVVYSCLIEKNVFTEWECHGGHMVLSVFGDGLIALV